MKLLKSCFAVAMLLLAGSSAAFADAVLSVVPTPSSVFVGQTFTVGIYVTGPTVIHNGTTFTSPVTDLDAFQFDVAFNCAVSGANATSCSPGASILNALSVTEGPFLTDGGSNFTFFEPGTINNSTGLISSIGDVGGYGVTGSGNLVNITFQALTAGTTSIAILANSDLQFFDSNGNPIVVANTVTTSPTKETFPTNQTLSANVTVVTPEPPSLELLLIGAISLAALMVSRRTLLA